MARGFDNPNTQGPLGNYDLLSRSEDHLEQLLDQALEATFPASDPIAVSPTPA